MDAKLEQVTGAASVPAPVLNGTRPSAGALAVLAAL